MVGNVRKLTVSHVTLVSGNHDRLRPKCWGNSVDLNLPLNGAVNLPCFSVEEQSPIAGSAHYKIILTTLPSSSFSTSHIR